MSSNATPEQKRAAITLMISVLDVIRTAGRIPSGHLYAQVMGHMDLRTYELIIERLKGTRLVEEKNHELIWVGPNLPKEESK